MYVFLDAYYKAMLHELLKHVSISDICLDFVCKTSQKVKTMN